MEKDELEQEKFKKVNKLQRFLFIVFIPLLFAITVALIVSTLLGHNVFEIAKDFGGKIPFISSSVNEENRQSVDKIEQEMIELEAEIKDREAKISQLETEIDKKDQEMDRAQLEQERLLQEIDELTAIKDENKRAFTEIIKTYETISAKKAAPILTAMEDQDAVRILSSVKPDTLAAIMEKLEPADAARFTELLTVAEGNE